jgi:hypothetical protein
MDDCHFTFKIKILKNNKKGKSSALAMPTGKCFFSELHMTLLEYKF